jgi:transposase
MFGYQRVKTDARDSTNLAELLRMDRLPEAWLAPPAVRELRELVRYRAKLVALRSGLKAQVHMLGREIAAVLAGDVGYLAIQAIPCPQRKPATPVSAPSSPPSCVSP